MKKTRISKKVRDEAILICAIAASNPRLSQNYLGVCAESGIQEKGDSYDLAIAAWELCPLTMSSNPDAEAEALLQTGWSP